VIRKVSGNTWCHSVQNVAFSDIQTDIVPVILCGFEIWCLTSRAGHRFKVCEKRVVRRIFGVMEVRRMACRRLCRELHVCYCPPDIINIIVPRKIKDLSCSMHILLKEGIQSLLRKTEQGEPLGGPQRMM
jgi:hypothetical protein